MTVLARLRELRQQAGARDFPEPSEPRPASTTTLRVAESPSRFGGVISGNPPARPVDDDLRSRIASLRRLIGHREALRVGSGDSRTRTNAASLDRTLPGAEVAPGVRLIEYSYACPPMPDALGLTALRSLPQQRQAHRQDPRGETEVAGARLLAIDTETTGLAGGTGTRAFMIGAADLDQGRLRVRQLLITTLGGEAAMLRIFCGWLRDDHVLVSYNGRSYDRPLLSTRLRLARLRDPLPALLHLDLLHVARRRYRGVWPNCRLATAERELLGVVRDDDLPGSEAPAAWLTFLRGGSSTNLNRVATHNDQDLRSLMGLVAHFATAGQRSGV